MTDAAEEVTHILMLADGALTRRWGGRGGPYQEEGQTRTSFSQRATPTFKACGGNMFDRDNIFIVGAFASVRALSTLTPHKANLAEIRNYYKCDHERRDPIVSGSRQTTSATISVLSKTAAVQACKLPKQHLRVRTAAPHGQQR